MSLQSDDARLLARAAATESSHGGMAEVSQGAGIEFATALLYDRISRQPANARFLANVQKLSRPKGLDADLVGIVPGAFHREHRHTGADGARVLKIARELGCAAEVVPVDSFGTLAGNAEQLLAWLTSRRERRIVLVSLSKGGADLKHALRDPRACSAFAPVRTWLSFSGLVYGTPLIDWLRQRPWRWWGVRLLLQWRGHPRQTLEDLRHGRNSALGSWPSLPSHLRLVHVCGFPLRHHLAHRWSERAYERLASIGPNDGGGVYLPDFLEAPGIVCPVWGADHYLAPRWDISPCLRGIVAAAAESELTG